MDVVLLPCNNNNQRVERDPYSMAANVLVRKDNTYVSVVRYVKSVRQVEYVSKNFNEISEGGERRKDGDKRTVI